MTIASSEVSSFWSAMQLGLEADAEGGAEAEAQEERDLLPCLCSPESSLLPRLPSVDRDGVGFKTSRRNWRMLADLVFFPLRSMMGYVYRCSEAICEKDVEALGLRAVGSQSALRLARRLASHSG